MKNITVLLALVACLGTAFINAQKNEMQAEKDGESFKNIEKFIVMEKGHTASWLEYAEKKHIAKYNLMIKHHNEKADLLVSMIKDKEKAGCGDAQMRKKHLEQMVNLHDKQVKEWKDLCDKERKDGEMLAEQNQKELNKFKQSIGMMPTEAEEKMKAQANKESMKAAPTKKAGMEEMDMEAMGM